MHDCGMRFLKTYKAICWSYIRPVGVHSISTCPNISKQICPLDIPRLSKRRFEMTPKYHVAQLQNMLCLVLQLSAIHDIRFQIKCCDFARHLWPSESNRNWSYFQGFLVVCVKVMAHLCIDVKRFSALNKCVHMCVCVCSLAFQRSFLESPSDERPLGIPWK